jgi:hypothetical protein
MGLTHPQSLYRDDHQRLMIPESLGLDVPSLLALVVVVTQLSSSRVDPWLDRYDVQLEF